MRGYGEPGLGPDPGAAALIFYFDTSALVKLVLPEPGSELVSALWRDGEPASSILAYPEGRAGIAAAHRGGRIDEETYARSLAKFEALHEELISIGIDEQLARSAGEHAARFRLRGYDAVHLATALELGEEAVVVTWDEDLRRAAEAAGMAAAGA